MADNLQINIGGNADGAKQAADEMGRSFAQNAGEMQKYLANLNTALDDFSKRTNKKITPFSLKDLDDQALQSYGAAIASCQAKIIDLQDTLRSLGARTNANGQEFDKLTKQLLAAENTYSKLQSQLVNFKGKSDEATEATDKLGKSTEKTGNFLRQIGVTTMLYGMARITNEFEKAAEAAVKFKEAAEDLENIKAPSGVETLANNLESISRVTDALQGAAAGAAAGAPFGAWGSGIGAVAGGVTTAYTGARNREMEAATNSAKQLRNVTDQIKNEKEQERFDLAKANFQTTFGNQLQMAKTPQERLEALGLAIGQFGNYSPEEIQKRIAYNKGKVDELNNTISSTTWDLGNDLDRHKLNILVKQRDKFQQSIEQDDAFLKDVTKTIAAAEKEIADKNKADIKAEEEAAKEAEKARKAKEKAEKEAAKKALKAKKDALNEEYKDLKDKKAKEQQLRRDTEKELSDTVSQREERMASITSTRDSISTSFSKVGGSVGPQFAALNKVLIDEQSMLRKYQENVTKKLGEIDGTLKTIDNDIKQNRKEYAVLG